MAIYIGATQSMESIFGSAPVSQAPSQALQRLISLTTSSTSRLTKSQRDAQFTPPTIQPTVVVQLKALAHDLLNERCFRTD